MKKRNIVTVLQTQNGRKSTCMFRSSEDCHRITNGSQIWQYNHEIKIQ